MAKQRQFHYVRQANGKEWFEADQELIFDSHDFLALDRFKDELVLIAIQVKLLPRISEVLDQLGLDKSIDYFQSECREVISVPEKHINEKTGKGNLSFQIYFKNVPESMASINEGACVVVALHPLDEVSSSGGKSYRLAGYVHANRFHFRDHTDNSIQEGYYYNLLRISSYTSKEGRNIYRQCGMFSSIFAILSKMCDLNGISCTYANFGRENRGMQRSIKILTDRLNKGYDRYPVDSYTHINWLFRRRSQAKYLVNISQDKAALQTFYSESMALREKYLFNQYPRFEDFKKMLDQVLSYSKSSGVYSYVDKEGVTRASCLAMNWGDYFDMTLDNPKGLFKLIAKLKLTDKILFPVHNVGELDYVKKLWQGLAYKFEKEEKVHITLLNTMDGDPYKSLKKSPLHDPFVYFSINNTQEEYDRFKKASTLEDGTCPVFMETPLL